ncbi:two-component sensor histidine kinase [Kibdelosporangium aridum]|uniref:histidine kinase n=1 Tax=Kibdelosporangium aridum TaxID=2030 RepID=A0A428YL66_KIBAR|nr:histidine kinase [Kibdelosporangium aridum]RSM68298.1 two-component sensor histidine kinase [Kibdelosporangium aridum]
MGIVWALVTGRDREFGPPIGWWRGPAWLGWSLLLGSMAMWTSSAFLLFAAANGGNSLVGVLVAAPEGAAVLLARHFPLTAVRLAFVATIVAAIYAKELPYPLGYARRWPLDAHLIPLAPVVALGIARAPKERMVGVALLAFGAMAVATVIVGVGYGADIMAGPIAGVIGAVIAGYILNDSRFARLESEHERQKRAHLRQRTKIARELHDVIGHHLSMIAVRTDSARYRLSGVTPEIQEEFSALGDAAREALTDARRLIGVLREDDGEAEHLPQPTIDDIPELVRSAIASGASVTVELPPIPGVSAMAGLAAYRIVQESLSNAMRHSPGTPISVCVRSAEDSIELSVENGPSGHVVEAVEGNGLAGIKERVSLVGGECAAGRRADGGFRVWAKLPR